MAAPLSLDIFRLGFWAPLKYTYNTGALGKDIGIVEARKLEHGFRRISARIPYSLP